MIQLSLILKFPHCIVMHFLVTSAIFIMSWRPIFVSWTNVSR